MSLDSFDINQQLTTIVKDDNEGSDGDARKFIVVQYDYSKV